MKHLFIGLLLMGIGYGSNLSPEEIRAQQEGLQGWNEMANSIDNMPPREAIGLLGKGIRKTARPDIYSIEGTKETAKRLKEAMLSIPGHAEHYRDRLLAAQEEVKANLDDFPQYGRKFSAFLEERMYGFQTLRELPSPETVRVLGDLLSEEWVSPRPIQGDQLDVSLAHKSAYALSYLPIVGKPYRLPNLEIDAAQIDEWRQWYQEIKDGKRTFRFEGDPTEYDLDGPAPKQKLERIALASRRDAERAHGRERAGTAADETGRETENTPGGLPAAVSIAAAALLFVSVAWYLARRQRGRVPRRGS